MTPARNKYLQELHKSHTPEAVRERLKGEKKHSYLRDFVYGAIDGAVTTFAVVSGVAGAHLATEVVLILGIANLVGDGFSMAVSNFLGTRTEREQHEAARKREEEHIRIFPEGEREEVRQIFIAKGFSGKELDHAVEVITSDSQRWVDTMLQEEMGLSLTPASPWRAASATFVAFMLIGVIPLLPFIISYFMGQRQAAPFAASACMTGVAFFIVGAVKSRFTGTRWYLAGLETLAVGAVAAGLAYGSGVFLSRLLA